MAPTALSLPSGKCRPKSKGRKLTFEHLEDRKLLAVLQSFDQVVAPNLPAGWVTSPSNPWQVLASNSDTAPNHAFVPNIGSISDSSLTSASFVLLRALLCSSFETTTKLKLNGTVEF